MDSLVKGLGQSKSAEAPAAIGELAPAGFLKEVCERLGLLPVVVISPSLSGMYSLPFLHQHQNLVRAYIPVAPICTDKFTPEQYQSIKVLLQNQISFPARGGKEPSFCFRPVTPPGPLVDCLR